MLKTKWSTKIVAAEMLKEGCVLKSDYINMRLKLTYEFENQDYTISWDKWMHDRRPHLNGGNRKVWSTEKVYDLLKNDECELIDNYTAYNTRMKYKYKGLIYTTSLSDWLSKKSRPHLHEPQVETNFKQYLTENNIKYDPQYTFDDLKDVLKLRFDFYLPELNLLVEIDDDTHKRLKMTIKHDKIKDDYCINNKIKLLRIDATTNDYTKMLNQMKDLPENLYILRCGRMYKSI